MVTNCITCQIDSSTTQKAGAAMVRRFDVDVTKIREIKLAWVSHYIVYDTFSSQNFCLPNVGRQSRGCVSSVAFSSSFHTLIVLSASPVISLMPVRSKVEAMIPASASSEPGCAIESSYWNLWPVFQSQKPTLPLSPPEKSTLSWLTEME